MLNLVKNLMKNSKNMHSIENYTLYVLKFMIQNEQMQCHFLQKAFENGDISNYDAFNRFFSIDFNYATLSPGPKVTTSLNNDFEIQTQKSTQ